MFKAIITLMRGSAAKAGEELADQYALSMLDQQIRDAGSAIERAKRALALAIAQDQQEARRLDAVLGQIADLETRVVAAMEAGGDALAREGAAAIASLEAERDASTMARSLFATEIERLRNHVRQAEGRLAALDRGRRIARAAEAVRDMKKGGFENTRPYEASLADAEKTLLRLRQQQIEAQAADDALADLDSATSPLTAAEKLAEAGFGARLKPTAEDVLARLKALRTAPAA